MNAITLLKKAGFVEIQRIKDTASGGSPISIMRNKGGITLSRRIDQQMTMPQLVDAICDAAAYATRQVVMSEIQFTAIKTGARFVPDRTIPIPECFRIQ